MRKAIHLIIILDILTKKQRSYCMSRIKAKNTRIETVFRHYIWSKGIRGYRANNSKVFGKPDIFFGRKRIAVFIDGCFWHKCPVCHSIPESNFGFWDEKLNKNRERDRKVNITLQENGIKVIRFWEHELENNIEKCYKRLVKELRVKQKLAK